MNFQTWNLQCLKFITVTVNLSNMPYFNKITWWSRILLEELIVPKPDKKYLIFYRTRMCITMFGRACYLSILWARLIQFTPPLLFHFLKIILITIYTRSPKWSLSLKCPHPNPIYTSHLHHMCVVPHPSLSSRFYHPNNIYFTHYRNQKQY